MSYNRYSVQFTIHVFAQDLDEFRACLAQLGDDLNLEEGSAGQQQRTVKVRISTADPHRVFDACSEFGRIKSAKINGG